MNRILRIFALLFVIGGIFLVSNCGSDDDGPVEPVTTLSLLFDPGGTVSYVVNGKADDIVLPKSTSFTVVLNISIDSAGTITDFDQIMAATPDQYQVFYSVSPPPPPTILANWNYLDQNLGVLASFVTLTDGDLILTVTVKEVALPKPPMGDIEDPDSVPGTVLYEASFNFTSQ